MNLFFKDKKLHQLFTEIRENSVFVLTMIFSDKTKCKMWEKDLGNVFI